MSLYSIPAKNIVKNMKPSKAIYTITHYSQKYLKYYHQSYQISSKMTSKPLNFWLDFDELDTTTESIQ